MSYSAFQQIQLFPCGGEDPGEPTVERLFASGSQANSYDLPKMSPKGRHANFFGKKLV